MTLTLPELPYAPDALAPHISAHTFEFHHGKHHKAYVDNGNKLLENSPLKGLPMEEIMRKTAGDANQAGIFNNVAQVWNHGFYWRCMKPGGGGAPTGKVAEMIKNDLGGFDKFVEAFKNAGATQFGSGWAWLVLDGGALKVTKTLNAANPLTDGMAPLLTMDVWEHAYYLDYQNRRPDYIATFIEKLINWDFVNANLGQA